MRPWCSVCGETFDNMIKCRKHVFDNHYAYALAQAQGDKNLLGEWMNLTE